MLIDHQLAQVFLSIAMVAVVALVLGGISLLRRARREGAREHRQKGWLMIAAALVLFGNVLIWTV